MRANKRVVEMWNIYPCLQMVETAEHCSKNKESNKP